MNQLSKAVYIKHSKIFFFPILNSLLYKFQLLLIRRVKMKNIYISCRNNTHRDQLLKLISDKYQYSIIQTYRFGRIIKNLKNQIILNLSINPKKLRDEELSQLMWTLVFTKYLNKSTKQSLKKFIFDKDFEVVNLNSIK